MIGSVFIFSALLTVGQITIDRIVVEPSSESEDIANSLPFKAGDVFEERYPDLAERLLKATEQFEDVKVEWDSDSRQILVRVHPHLYFDTFEWSGDLVSGRSDIERLCFRLNETINLTQERLSQMNRCIVGDLQAAGFLDASVGLNADGTTLQIEVDKGNVYTVSSTQISGIPPSLERELARRLTTEVGKPFQPTSTRGDTAFILKELLKKGYFYAEVFQPLVQVSPEKHSVALQWNAKQGPRFEVRFLGEYLSTKPLDEMIAREETFPKWFVEELQDQITSELRAEGYLDTEVIIRRKMQSNGVELIKLVTVKGDKYTTLSPDLVGVLNFNDVKRVVDDIPALSAGRSFNSKEYKSAVNDTLVSELYSEGYLDLQVRGIDFTIDKEKARVRPVIYLAEGDGYFIQNVHIEGLTPDVEDMSEWSDFEKRIKTGQSFDQLAIDELKVELQRALVAQGYLDADVVLGYEKATRVVNISVILKLGPRYRVAQILVRGANKTKESVLRQEADLEPGDLFLDDSVREGIDNILRLGIVRSVDFRVLEKDPQSGHVFVLIDIVEAARFRFEIGPGYGTLDGIRGVFKGTYANIGGTGRRLSLFAKANRKLEEYRTPDAADFLDPREIPFIERRISLEYFEPRFLTLPLDGRLTFANSKQDFPSFGLFKNTFSAALDYRLNRFFLLTSQYDLEYQDPFNVKKGINTRAFDDEEAKTLTSLTQIVLFQFLDDTFNPIKGFRTRLVGSLYHDAFGGDQNFWQTTIKQDFYYPVWRIKKDRTLGFALSLNSGFSDAMKPTREIPVTKRFYVGGESSVRGFDDQSINPKGRVGGNSYFYFQTEVNIPVAFGADLLGFLDAGNLYAENSGWKPWNLRYGAGGGVRWNTPVGPLKIGYGFNLHRRRIDGKIEPIGAFYFGVGVI